MVAYWLDSERSIENVDGGLQFQEINDKVFDIWER